MLVTAGCAAECPEMAPPCPVVAPHCPVPSACSYTPPPCGIILVADGAGGFEGTSDRLREVVAEQRLPLQVQTVDWTHGYLRAFADHLDLEHTLAEAKFLAGEIVTLLRREPRPKIYLVAHSAGAGVVLPAVQYLPPNSIERMILLAPAVSADYDIRPALRTSRSGLENFYSERDRFILDFGIRVFGTTDRRRGSPAAGLVGFRPPPLSPEELPLLNRLHQHPWEPSMIMNGNRGGHYGSYEPEFLRAYIIPLLR
jgi:pimeloyl-ACP methyl ester carboxylesterase